MVSRETLVEAVKALNSSGLSKKQVSPDLKRYEELKEKFLEAAETVPISREEELPTIVGQTYNQIVSEEDEVVKPEPVKAEPKKPEPEPKKPERAKVEKTAKEHGWRPGSSCQRFYEIMIEAGDKGISIDEAVKIAEERQIPAKNAKSRIVDVWYTATRRGIAEKRENLYYAK